MKLLLYISIILILFATLTVVTFFRINSFYSFGFNLMMFISFITIVGKVSINFYTKYKEALHIILFAILTIFIKIFIDDPSGVKGVLFFSIIPLLLFILINSQEKSIQNNIKNIILIFFVVECFLAIYEFILNINFFDYIRLEDDDIYTRNVAFGDFRSTALLGNPLANALVVSIILSFIIASNMKLKNKIIFFLIGHTALFSFNARGAIFVWAIIDVFFLISIYKYSNSKNMKSAIIFTPFLLLLILAYLNINYGFGGRLFSVDLLDGGAQVRLELDNSFRYLDNQDFWFGSNEKLNFLLVNSYRNSAGTENSGVMLIYQFGIFLLTLMSVLYYFWFKKILNSYNLLNKVIILSAILVVGSTNNSLGGSTPWMFLALCASCFEGNKDNNLYFFKKKTFVTF